MVLRATNKIFKTVVSYIKHARLTVLGVAAGTVDQSGTGTAGTDRNGLFKRVFSGEGHSCARCCAILLRRTAFAPCATSQTSVAH